MEDRDSWIRLLVNTELMIEDRGRAVPSAGGLLLFGARPNRYLPQSGISAAAYNGTEKSYDAKGRATLRGPVVSLFSAPTQEFGLYPRMARTLFGEPRRGGGRSHRAGTRFRAP
jgi:ATP-dependent DNA helicase RecG